MPIVASIITRISVPPAVLAAGLSHRQTIIGRGSNFIDVHQLDSIVMAASPRLAAALAHATQRLTLADRSLGFCDLDL
jgi:hypothetical protein